MMNGTIKIQYPEDFDKEISDEEKKEISDQFLKAYFDAQEPIDTRVKTDAVLFFDYKDDDDDDYPDDGDDNYTADDDDDDDATNDDDDDDDTDDDTIKLMPLEQLIRLKIGFAHEVLNRATEWQGELLSSQNAVKLASEVHDYALRASTYAEKACMDSREKTASLNYQALLCYERVMRANVAFKKSGLLSPNSGSVFSEAQDADNMLAKALKSYDEAYHLSVARRIVWRNTAVITADAYQKLSLEKEGEAEADAAYVYWSSKAHDALVALPRAED